MTNQTNETDEALNDNKCPACGRQLDDWSECQMCINNDERLEGWPDYPEDDDSDYSHLEREDQEPDYAN